MQCVSTREKTKELFVFDYDGTLTTEPATVEDSTLEALLELREKRSPIMGVVSGRQFPFLVSIRRQTEIFDFLIAENGAIIFYNGSKTKRVFGVQWARRAHEVFQNANIPLDFGEVVIATKSTFENRVKGILAAHCLPANVEPNKDSLMVLPPGVDKGTALEQVIDAYGGKDFVFTASFGDSENDMKIFEVSNRAVAVENAVPSLKEKADAVTNEAGGRGVSTYLRESLI